MKILFLKRIIFCNFRRNKRMVNRSEIQGIKCLKVFAGIWKCKELLI